VHVDGSGKFLIPGLWDMHVHMVFGDWFSHGSIRLPISQLSQSRTGWPERIITEFTLSLEKPRRAR
jgi:cytosine/adenosine deaminase-related metal-dependent hydrolase